MQRRHLIHSLRTLSAVACLIASTSAVRSQTNVASFRRFTLRDGLSQSTVNAITQDRTGFLWFGTADGLNRYDGYTCKVFRFRERDSTTLPDDNIMRLLVDRGGRMWIGTYNGGLALMDPLSETVRRFARDRNDSTTLRGQAISALHEDPDGTVWVGTWGGGLARVHMHDDGRITFSNYRRLDNTARNLPDDRISAILRDSRGILWVGTWGGLCRLVDDGGTTLEFAPAPLHQKFAVDLSGIRVWVLREGSDGTLWVGTVGGGLYAYDRDRKSLRAYRYVRSDPEAVSDDNITSILEDRTGALWIGTAEGGLNKCEREGMTFTHFHHDPNDPEGISDNGIIAIFEDRAGGLWIGTSGSGICSLDPKRERFLHYRHRPGDQSSLAHNMVRALFVDAVGDLWVGTRGGGLDLQRHSSSAFTHFTHSSQNPHSLSSDNVLSVYQRRNGEVWVGTQYEGLNRYHPTTNSFDHFTHDPRNAGSLAQNSVFVILEDRAGTLWVGTGDGLDRYDDRTGTFTHHRQPGPDPGSISGNWVWSLYEDQRGHLWVGTWGMGLNRYDGEQKRFTHYLHNPADSTSLSNNTILCITGDPDGHLWIGTEGGGLDRFDPDKGLFQHYGEHLGLPSDVVYGIVRDGQGNLWLSTNRGVSRFNPRAGTFRNFDYSDGLQNNEFNQGAYCVGGDGTIYFGGIEGFNEFHPDGITDNPSVPTVVLTGLSVNGQPIPVARTASMMPRVTLAYDENNLTFEFAALEYTAPEKNEYACMLEGSDATWVHLGTRRYVNYSKLEGGDYTFRVRASNNDGVWNMEGLALPISIVPPFWQTWWFRILLVGGIAALLVLFYRYRVTQLLAIERMRVRIASDLHDDIGSTLTKIAVQSEVIQSISDPGKIRSLSQQIGASSREVIQALADVVWSIDARHDTVGNLLDRTKDFALEVLTPRHITVKFSQNGLNAASTLPVELRQNIYLIFKEAVNNIARHSDARHVTISFDNTDGSFAMVVADDGKSIGEGLLEGGHGLRNMEMRARRIQGALNISCHDGVKITLVRQAI
jgi:ligand-binding sensor domain-containing protein/signal transduction histidine kinase